MVTSIFDRTESLVTTLNDLAPRIRQLQEQTCPRLEPNVVLSIEERLQLTYLPIKINMLCGEDGKRVLSDDRQHYIPDGAQVASRIQHLESVLTSSANNYNDVVSPFYRFFGLIKKQVTHNHLCS